MISMTQTNQHIISSHKKARWLASTLRCNEMKVIKTQFFSEAFIWKTELDQEAITNLQQQQKKNEGIKKTAKFLSRKLERKCSAKYKYRRKASTQEIYILC